MTFRLSLQECQALTHGIKGGDMGQTGFDLLGGERRVGEGGCGQLTWRDQTAFSKDPSQHTNKTRDLRMQPRLLLEIS